MLLTDCLVDAQNQAGGFCGGLQSVDLDQAGLPDKLLHVVRNTLCLEVNTCPGVALPVLHTQPVQDVCGIDTGVVAQLPRDYLQCFCEGLDDGLLLVGNLCVGVVVQEGRDLHLNSTASCYDVPVLDGALDDHDGVVQTALDLSDELLGTSYTEWKDAMIVGLDIVGPIVLAALTAGLLLIRFFRTKLSH